MKVVVYDNEGRVLFERRREGGYKYVTFPLAADMATVTRELEESVRVIRSKGTLFEGFAVVKSLEASVDADTV